MSFIDWVQETRDRARQNGVVSAAKAGAYEFYVGGLRRINTVYSKGENIYDRDWDLLILLDACRVDLISEVDNDYEFLDAPGELTSVGSSSLEWLQRTFCDEYVDEMQKTAYVTGNPFSYRVLDEDDFLVFDEVWTYAWDDEAGTIPARPLTDRTIAAAREHSPDRLIVHYMQPHLPSVPDPLSDGMNAETLGQGKGWESPWKLLRRGELTYERVWDAYRANLNYVLSDVELLLRNVDAERAVISADHGNAAGEFGVYGHPRVPLSVVRQVPWYETTAIDEGGYEPDFDPETNVSDTIDDVEDRLSALGYR
ncbi:hypothetical protein [Halobellus ruber]|uniref:Uncharacterized protein n=1 Tax=Halobellus ruber TaxID=2761102 RepID=A0A7J9SEA6_9EURY|nr:hypothetical protein [Halobellus ruber]MBB6644723.1 hypothetical protein [Halobellus ruber]